MTRLARHFDREEDNARGCQTATPSSPLFDTNTTATTLTWRTTNSSSYESNLNSASDHNNNSVPAPPPLLSPQPLQSYNLLTYTDSYTKEKGDSGRGRWRGALLLVVQLLRRNPKADEIPPHPITIGLIGHVHCLLRRPSVYHDSISPS